MPRNMEAARQASALELVLSKAVILLNLDKDPKTMPDAIAALSNVLLEAYGLGAVEVLQVQPFENREVAYPGRVTPEALNRMGLDGWEPWFLTECLVPAHVNGKPGVDDVPGMLVRYKRRCSPATNTVVPFPSNPING